ncbi:MAG: efflux RND transporter periplasmic adaptor subunit [Rhodospirillaceae bacterium]|nr:efflux RND transporter periplasmic adaptor subunit [Rhodospirillaceae bacterium]
MRPRHIVLGILMASAVVGAAYIGWSRFLGPRQVETGEVVRGPAVAAVYATGTVEPVREVEIAPTIRGRVIAIRCGEGDRVVAGEILVEFDAGEVKAQLAEAEAVLSFQRQELDRFRELAERNTATRQTLERTVSLHEQARAGVDAARQRLADLTLAAPFDAIVLRREHEIGDVLDAGQTVCWLGQEPPFRVSAEIDEEDIPLIARGQAALVKADAFPDLVIEATVDDVTPRGDSINKSYRARMMLPADSPLFVGMTVEVNVIVREVADAVLAPAAAYRDGALWVVADGAAERRAVQTGIIGNEFIEIVEGVDAGDRVILNPPIDLVEGDRLESADR